MKYLLSLATLCVALSQSFCQSPQHETQSLTTIQKNLILDILASQGNQFAEKPTAVKQRVIAQSVKSTTANDSTRYRYSGVRGSRFNYNLFGYSNKLTGPYQPAFTYPGNAQSPHILADTVSFFKDGDLKYKDYAVYLPDNKFSFIYTDYNGTSNLNRARSSYTYNGNGDMDARYSSLYGVSVPLDTSSILKYSYENNRLATDSSWLKNAGVLSLLSYSRFYYNTPGKLEVDSIFSVSGLSANREFTYYNDGRLCTITTTSFSGNTIVEVLKDSLGYTGQLEYVTFWKTQNDNFSNNTSWSKLEVKYPGANDMPDSTTVLLTVNGSETSTVFVYEYNEFDNPERILKYDGGNTSGTANQVSRFYYETYDDELAVNEIGPVADLRVYPNPFNKQVSLECSGLPDQHCTFHLLNAVGSNVFSTRLLLHNGKVRIALPSLPAGFYLLSAQMADGRMLNKRIVKNQ